MTDTTNTKQLEDAIDIVCNAMAEQGAARCDCPKRFKDDFGLIIGAARAHLSAMQSGGDKTCQVEAQQPVTECQIPYGRITGFGNEDARGEVKSTHVLSLPEGMVSAEEFVSWIDKKICEGPYTRQDVIDGIKQRDAQLMAMQSAGNTGQLPTNEMVTAGVEYALASSISGENKWPDYIRGLFQTMMSVAPKPAMQSPPDITEGEIEAVAKAMESEHDKDSAPIMVPLDQLAKAALQAARAYREGN